MTTSILKGGMSIEVFTEESRLKPIVPEGFRKMKTIEGCDAPQCSQSMGGGGPCVSWAHNAHLGPNPVVSPNDCKPELFEHIYILTLQVLFLVSEKRDPVFKNTRCLPTHTVFERNFWVQQCQIWTIQWRCVCVTIPLLVGGRVQSWLPFPVIAHP